MRKLHVCTRAPAHLVALGGILAAASGALPAARAAEVTLGQQTFQVPEGFTIELAAGPPLVERPIVAELDEEGRLYVTESSGANEPPDRLLALKPHRILRLEDTDRDGHFDKRTVFAEGLTFPEGAVWYQGALYVASPPDVLRLQDSDGDGVADRRSVWLTGFTLNGKGSDLHGPMLGQDGFFYVVKSGSREVRIVQSDGAVVVKSAASILRVRPDGTGIETVMSAGMDNPVEVAFTPEHEPLLTCTFCSVSGNGNRDGLVHVVWGGVYPKYKPTLDDLPRTGELLPAMTNLGPAAPAGLARYASDAFGRQWRDNFFSAQFNLAKVQRHVVTRSGSTFVSRDEDFVASNNRHFHPTDVLEDADGSLLIVDTGGWYKAACPTSQIARPEVTGGVYRVRRTAAPPIRDPRGQAIAWASLPPAALGRLLDDDRPVVRRRATDALAKGGATAIPTVTHVLIAARTAEARRNAVWALTRMDEPAARAAVRRALRDADNGVRQAAAHSAGLHRDRLARGALEVALRSSSWSLRREAATALGRIGDRSAVNALVRAAAADTDRMLDHALTFALMEIADPVSTRQALRTASARARRVALIALDQMKGGGLGPSDVVGYLDAADPALRETASWIVRRHGEWGPAVVGVMRGWLDRVARSTDVRDRLKSGLVALIEDPAVQNFIGQALRDSSTSLEARLVLLEVIAAAPPNQTPPAWGDGLGRALASSEEPVVRLALEALQAMPVDGRKTLSGGLLRVARATPPSPAWPLDVRLRAIAALPPLLQAPEAALFRLLLDGLDPAQPPLVRTTAANVLGRARLADAQLVALTGHLRGAGALELPGLVAAYSQCRNAGVQQQLVTALDGARGLGSLRPQVLLESFRGFAPGTRIELETIMKRLTPDLDAQKARLAELEPALGRGDRAKGAEIFNGQKAGCTTCHRIGYRGGQVGPDLTRIGAIRSERDLLEAIVFPSASFARGYEPMVVKTKNGQQYAGIVREEAGDNLRVVSNATTEARLRRSEIAEMEPDAVSPMPAGWDQILTPEELGHLVKFLRALQ